MGNRQPVNGGTSFRKPGLQPYHRPAGLEDAGVSPAVETLQGGTAMPFASSRSALRPAWALGLIWTIAYAPTASAEVQIILHAIPHPDYVHCFVPTDELGYQNPTTQTQTTIPANSLVDVFIYVYGYDQINGIGFKLGWPNDWEYRGWSGDCLPPYQIVMTTPDPAAGTVDLATVFNERTGGALLPIGFVSLRTGDSGTVNLIAGTTMCRVTHAVACYVRGSEEIPIPIGETGIVEIGGPGYNPSGPAPVADATWGKIKAAYRN